MLTIKRIFIKDHLSRPLRFLYAHKIIRDLGIGLLGFFVPLFLFNLFGRIEYVILYYLAIHIVTMVFYPIATKLFLRFNLKSLMMVALIFLMAYLLVLNHLKVVGISIFWLVAAVILINIYRWLYWTPYHAEFALLTEKEYRGRELSILYALVSFLGISLPAIAAFVVVKLGFNWLFWIVLSIELISVLPLFKVPNKKEKYSYGYWQTWRELFSKKNRGLLLAYFADGFQGAAGYVVWPIFIFLLLDKEYMSVGVISTLIILASVILRLLLGDLVDRISRKKVLKVGSWLYSLGWLIKAFVSTGFQIFTVGAYHGLAEVVMRTPFDTLMYDKAADREHYIDEYTVLREMALRIGKISVLLFALLIVSLVSLNWVFIAVSMVALLVNFI